MGGGLFSNAVISLRCSLFPKPQQDGNPELIVHKMAAQNQRFSIDFTDNLPHCEAKVLLHCEAKVFCSRATATTQL